MPITRIINDKRAREKPCLRCGTALRDVVERHCPHCGLSLWVSLNQNDPLDASNPTWQRRMALGAFVLAAAMFLGLAGFGIGALPWAGDHHLLGATLSAAYFAVQAIGLFLFCSTEGRHPERLRPLRFAARALAIVGLLAAAAIVLEAVVVNADIPPPVTEDEVDAFQLVGNHFLDDIAGLFAKVVLAASMMVIGKWANAIARRGHRRGLATFARWLSLGPMVGLVLAVPLTFFCFVSMLSIVIEVVVLATLSAAPFMLVWTAIMLTQTRPEAAAMWAAETKLGEMPKPGSSLVV